MQTSSASPPGRSARSLVGLAFAFGWTPCIGPILAAILAVAGHAGHRRPGHQAAGGLLAGPGRSVPAHVAGHQPFFAAFARIRRHYHAIEIVSGVLLVAIGVLIFTNRFTVIARCAAAVPAHLLMRVVRQAFRPVPLFL